MTSYQRITVQLAIWDRHTSSVIRRPARAYQSATPGLAVRRLATTGCIGAWGIDHIPTGKSVSGLFGTRLQANSHATRLGQLCDWTAEAPAVDFCGQCGIGGTERSRCERCGGLGLAAKADAEVTA